MNTLERNRFTDAWRSFGQLVGRPRAVLVISAHWYTNATALTAMATPRTRSLSMACYGVGLDETPAVQTDEGTAELPNPEQVPTELTNL